MLTPRQEIELTIEKPAAGGRMIARHDGQVVLVAGAVPGERVAARVERAERRIAFAVVTRVLEASPDRRDGFSDAACGGCAYSHVAYPRQLALKGDILRETFLRIGHIALEQTIAVAESPERDYRMRARFHVHGSRVGFYREGTHTLCEPQVTGQLRDGALDSVNAAVAALTSDGYNVVSVELTERHRRQSACGVRDVDGGRGGQPQGARTRGRPGRVARLHGPHQTKRIGDVGEP